MHGRWQGQLAQNKAVPGGFSDQDKPVFLLLREIFPILDIAVAHCGNVKIDHLPQTIPVRIRQIENDPARTEFRHHRRHLPTILQLIPLIWVIQPAVKKIGARQAVHTPANRAFCLWVGKSIFDRFEIAPQQKDHQLLARKSPHMSIDQDLFAFLGNRLYPLRSIIIIHPGRQRPFAVLSI